MRILVTGSEGNIGRATVERLQAQGHDLRTFDRPAARRAGIPHHPGDLRDPAAVRQAAQGVEAIVHLGAIPGDHGPADELFAVNVGGTLHVLLAAAEAGVGRVVFFSSVNALGCVGPLAAPARFPIGDDAPKTPRTPYQLSKHLGEESCRAFSERHGIVTLCLRPVGVVDGDPQGAWRSAAEAMRAQWEKDELWAYVDRADVVDAVERALTIEDVAHDAFLLAAADTTMETPTAELVARFHPDVSWDAPGDDRPFTSLFDCRRARDILGWTPKRSWRRPEGSP